MTETDHPAGRAQAIRAAVAEALVGLGRKRPWRNLLVDGGTDRPVGVPSTLDVTRAAVVEAAP